MKKIILFIISLLLINSTYSQCTAPSFNVDLSATTDTSWTLSGAHRNGVCCGSSNCVTFNVIINPGTELISFDVTNPSPSGSAYYQVNCGAPVSIGTPLCAVGLVSPFTITYCKPGGDSPDYIITAGTIVHASNDISIHITGCTDTLYVSNVQTSSITWTSIYPGAQGAYDSYLSCTTGCNTTLVTPTGTPPPYVDFQVSGNPNVACGSFTKDTVRVYFVPHLIGTISPASPVICASSGDNVTLTANAIDGNPPYHYHWSTGPSSQSITTGTAGTYVVTISDHTNCPPVVVSRTIGTIPSATFSFSYSEYCKNESNPLPLFTDGLPGVFSASPAGLSFVSTSTGEINLAASTAGTYTVTNTIAASGSCPGASASSTVTINPFPTMTSTSSATTCSGNTLNIPLTSDISSTYTWVANENLNVLGESTSAQTTSNITDILYNHTIGNEIISYTVIPTSTLSGNCIGSSQTVDVTVVPLDDSSFTYNTSTNCQTGADPIATITGLPGGTFSSTPGLVFVSTATGTIDLSASTLGSYIVTYTTNGACPNTETFPIAITVAPSAIFSYFDSPYCQDHINPFPTYGIGASGGTFTSNPGLVFVNTATGEVNLALSTPGTYTVTNTIDPSGGCAAAIETSSITITKHESSAFSYPQKVFCQTASNPLPIFVGGSIAGTFTSTAGLVINAGTGEIDLAASTPGTYTVTNTIDPFGGCPIDLSTYTISITALPSAIISYSASPYCQNGIDPLPTLAFGSTSGTYTASSIFLSINPGTGLIDLSNSIDDTYIVTNTVAAANGCPAVSDTAEITITSLPIATLSYVGTPYCQNDANPTPLIASGGSNGIFTANPAGLSIEASSGTVDLTLSTPGTYTVTNTVPAAAGCEEVSASTSITVTALPSAVISYTGTPYCNSETNPQAISISGTSGGTFSAPAGLSIDPSTGAITPNTSTPGMYTVTYTISAADGCSIVTETTDVTITDLPTASILYAGSPFCSTVSTATVNLTGNSGGIYTAPLGLSIDPSSGEINIASSTPGNYNVTYTIAASNGCSVVTATTPITITQLPAATISYTGTPYCNSETNPQAISISGTAGGTFSAPAGLSFDPSTGAITPNTSTPGSYTVTYIIAAADGCGIVTTNTNITITDLPAASISYTGSPFCNMDPNSSVSYTGTSGGSYSASLGLSVDPTSGEVTPSTSIPGTYTVTYTIAAADGCGTVTTDTQVTINEMPTASAVSTGILCYGETTDVVVTGANGTSPYSGEGTFNEYAGSYNYTITDINGCTATASITLTQPDTLIASSSATPILCFGGTTVVSVTETGGTSPFIGDGTFTESIGSYSYTVTDANGCQSTTNITISEPPVITSSISTTFAGCGLADGSATVAASGGTGTLSFVWPSTNTNATENGLAAGSYILTITDDNGCSLTDTAIILNSGAPTVLDYSENVLCHGLSTGSIDLTVSGGTGSYTFDWNNGAFNTEDLSNIPAGIYNFDVVDDANCHTIGSITISEPDTLIASSISTPILCHSDTSYVTVTSIGGTGIVTGTGTFAVVAGNHSFTVTDMNGCTATTNITIAQPDTLIASSVSTNILCYGDTSLVTITAIGGTGNYTGTGIFPEIAGTYTYYVSDDNGCIDSSTITISQPDTLIASSISTQILCFGGSSEITVSALGGTMPYTGTGTYSVNAGTYDYTVMDNNNCISTTSILITEPALLVTNVSSTNAGCGLSDGSATVSASGGTGSYTYLWSPSGGTNVTETGLSAGNYSVVTEDSNGCSVTDNVVVINSDAPTTNTFVTNILCYGLSTGAVDLEIIGGISPYVISWNNGSYLSEDLTDIPAGTYDFVVTDSANCQSTGSVEIYEPTLLTSSLVSVNSPLCSYSNDGRAIVQANGGTAPYTFAWNDILNTLNDTILTLSGDSDYYVTISDANGCTTIDSVQISSAIPVILTSTITDAICTASNGSIVISATGGAAPYNYMWNDPSSSTNDTLINLLPGSYSVTITDNNLCVFDTTFQILQLSGTLGSSINSIDITCFGYSNGTLSAIGVGGTNPLTYQWSNSQNTSSITNLNQGAYSVTITDNNGCSSVSTANVAEPDPISILDSLYITNGNTGNIEITVTGGTSPYSYIWSNNETTEHITYISNGEYTVTVSDFNSCTSTLVVQANNLEMELIIPTIFTPNNDGKNDDFEIKNIEFYSNISIEIYNRWGDRIFLFTGSGNEYLTNSNRWNGVLNGKDLPMGSYVYIVIIDNHDPYTGVTSIIR